MLNNNLSHAYIISARGDEGFAKATELAAAMLCENPAEGKACGACRHCKKSLRGIHPDVMVYSRPLDDKGKPKRDIPVATVRAIGSTLAVMPNEAEKKVYIIREAGAMTAEAQNALLKMLEEPPWFDAFILITENPRLLLDTVISRCVGIKLGGGEDELPPEAREKAERYIAIAAKGDELALLSFANEHGDMSVAQCTEFVTGVRLLLTDMLCGRLPDLKMSREELLRLAELMGKCLEYLRFNVSTKHLLGLLSVTTIQWK